MAMNEGQYERIARRLDGESVELTVEEQAAAEEIRRSEAALAGQVEVDPPREALVRARRRVVAALLRPRRRRWRYAAVAAAAVLLVVVGVLWILVGRTTPATSPWQGAVSMANGSVASENMDLDVIAAELDELEADWAVSLPTGASDAEFDALEESLEIFWLDDVDLEGDES